VGAGADVNAKTPKGSSPLLLAKLKGHSATAEVLAKASGS